MTEMTAAYIESIANGVVPAYSSEERSAYFDELGANRDYTWALQKFQEIMEMDWYEDPEARFTDFAECGICDASGHDDQDCPGNTAE